MLKENPVIVLHRPREVLCNLPDKIGNVHIRVKFIFKEDIQLFRVAISYLTHP